MKANRDPFTGYADPPIVPCYKDDQGRLCKITMDNTEPYACCQEPEWCPYLVRSKKDGQKQDS